MNKIRFLARKILGRDKIKSTTRDYWVKSARAKEEKTISRICDGFDRSDFETKKDSIVFTKEFHLSSDAIVLDLACGMGRTCKWVAPHVKQYVGVDFIPEMIEKAKNYNEKILNAKFVVNDGNTLRLFPNEAFDIIYSELAFQHMLKPTQKSYVNEVYRLLKKNGVFYIQLPRIEYYNDDSFAHSRREADDLFKGFKIKFLEILDAYYIIKAKKLENYIE